MKIKLSNCGLIGIFVFMGLCWCIWGEGYFMSCGLSPDGVSYLRMSEAAARGHLFNPNGVSGHWGWFANWPLGYPWCIALVMKISTLDSFTAARVVATLVAGGVLVLLARFARPAFPVLALSLLNFSFCGILRIAYSEQLYVLALLALCFVLSRKGEGGKKITIAAITGLSIAAFLFRYIGVFAVFWAMAASYLVSRFYRRRWNMLRTFAFSTVFVGGVVIGYLVLNRIM